MLTKVTLNLLFSSTVYTPSAMHGFGAMPDVRTTLDPGLKIMSLYVLILTFTLRLSDTCRSRSLTGDIVKCSLSCKSSCTAAAAAIPEVRIGFKHVDTALLNSG